MKYKWQKALSQINFTEDQLSKSLQNQISEFRDVETSIDQLTASINEIPEDAADDRESIQNEIDEFEKTLNALDADLAKKITNYPATKQKMDDLAAKRREKKAASQNNPPADPPVDPPADPAPQDPPADPAPQDPPADPAPQDPPTDPKDPAKKKGGDWLGIGVGIGLAVLTFGLYWRAKNRA